jgi:hypothetical protein
LVTSGSGFLPSLLLKVLISLLESMQFRELKLSSVILSYTSKHKKARWLTHARARTHTHTHRHGHTLLFADV